jgi:hypothetical protein
LIGVYLFQEEPVLCGMSLQNNLAILPVSLLNYKENVEEESRKRCKGGSGK